jgi:hypothetical protein
MIFIVAISKNPFVVQPVLRISRYAELNVRDKNNTLVRFQVTKEKQSYSTLKPNFFKSLTELAGHTEYFIVCSLCELERSGRENHLFSMSSG